MGINITITKCFRTKPRCLEMANKGPFKERTNHPIKEHSRCQIPLFQYSIIQYFTVFPSIIQYFVFLSIIQYTAGRNHQLCVCMSCNIADMDVSDL